MAAPLTALEQAKNQYGDGCAACKRELLESLERVLLPSAAAVVRLHEVLCFLRAYPDDAALLTLVERMLAGFHRRADLRRQRAALADTGIAGTLIHYRFFWPTAQWLASRWPDRLKLDRSDPEPVERIRAALGLLVTPGEATWLKESRIPTYAALDRLRAAGETDALFLVRQVQAMPGNSMTRETFADAIDAAYVLEPGPDTPTRTLARYRAAPLAFRTAALRRARPALRTEIARAPRAVHDLPRREGRRLIDLARGVMVTRSRDLDGFAYGDERDVRIVDDENGAGFMVNGVVPERRALIPALYGYLTLQNGIPIGYGQLDLVGGSAAIAFNTFSTFRGAEAAWNFARLLAMSHWLFGTNSFSLEPYQLGHQNPEGIASGAWWFYYKLGFRPRAGAARRILREELARSRANPAHRSAPGTLRKLAAWPMFYHFDPSRPAPTPPLAAIGAGVARAITRRSARSRAQGMRECHREAMAITGLRTLNGFSADERRAWLCWAPLVVALEAAADWSTAEKRSLVEVIRAKGARRESDFVARFTAHGKLARALGRDWD
ncbi:MAG: hypothetical protein OEW21_06020 [Betaproteobacteria bacterium]|nr:hypothetical protein [Betaproteobacteria bacterium]